MPGLYRQMGAVELIADPLGLLGQLALQEGHLQEAYDLTVASIEITRAVDKQVYFGDWGGLRLGLIQLYLGEIDAAEQIVQDALRLLEEVTHDMRAQLEAYSYLSEIALVRGEISVAATYLQSSLNFYRTLYQQLQATAQLEGTPDPLPLDLIGLCAAATAQENYVRAATLHGWDIIKSS